MRGTLDTEGTLDQEAGDVSEALAALDTKTLDRSVTNGVIYAPTIIRRTADSAAITSDTTIDPDDTLLWAVTAESEWFFEAFLITNAANAAMDVKFGWAVPAGTTMLWGGTGTAGSGVAGYGPQTAAITPAVMATESQSMAFGTAVGTSGVSLAGTVDVGATAGNVVLTWAQNTSDAGQLKLLKNSILRVTRLA